MKILVIEDDNKIQKSIGFAFQVGWPGVKVVSAELGQVGLELVEKESPDAVILDLMLPDMDGLDIIKSIRSFSSVPILVLSVITDESILVQALELGANDYVSKPFRQMELLARIKSLLKWRQYSDLGESLVWGTFVFNYGRHELTFDNKKIVLTGIENEALNLLIRNSPEVVSYESLARSIWGENYDSAMNSIKVHIRHLREKIEPDPSEPQIILTKMYVGYYAIKPA